MRDLRINAACAAMRDRLPGKDSKSALVSISFGERLPPDLVRSAWSAVARRHPVLRASFPDRETLRLLDAPEWKTVDWTAQAPEAIPALWQELQDAERVAPGGTGAALRIVEITLPGGAAHYLMVFPAYVLDEESVAVVLGDWLTALGGESLGEELPLREDGPAEMSLWREVLDGASGPLELHDRFPQSHGELAALLLEREDSATFLAACRERSLDPAAVTECLAMLVLRRLGASGNVAFTLARGPSEWSSAGFAESWVPVTHRFQGPLKDILSAATARRERICSSSAVRPSAALASAGCTFGAESVGVSFAWRGAVLNDVIHTRFPRWINFDARWMPVPVGGLCLEVRQGVRLALSCGGASLSNRCAGVVVSHLADLLRGFATMPDAACEKIPLLPVHEAKEVREFSRGEALENKAATVVSAFRETVRLSPDAVAVRDGDYALTFAELDTLSDRLALHFSHLGLAGGWQVGLFLSPSSWIPISMLGAFKAGNCVIPIDPSTPPAQVEKILSDHDVAAVLCDVASSPLLDANVRKRLVIDQDWDSLEVAEGGLLEIAEETPAAALVGGAAGPAPVLKALTHTALANAARTAARLLSFGPGDSLLVHSAAGNGAFFDEWLIPVLNGGTAVVVDTSVLDPAMAEVSHVRLTAPEFANQAARGGALTSTAVKVLAVECGLVNARVLERWASWEGRVVPFWSPAGLCGLGLAGGGALEGVFLPAGTPVGGNSAFIRDADGHDLPPFFAGELMLRFPGQLTSGEKGGRTLRTGLRAWRDFQGAVSLESFETVLPGLPTSSQRVQIAAAVQGGALDAWFDGRLATVHGTPGSKNFDEWPLDSLGWVDPTLLFPAPAPAAVAKGSTPRVVEAAPRRSEVVATPLVVLQASGPGTRLVLIHPADGTAECYRELAQAVGTARRVVCLQSPGLANPDQAAASVESAAAAFVSTVLEDDPAGRFVLAGFGFGGLVAMEMARQLQCANRPAPPLVLIGTMPPALEAQGGIASFFRSAIQRVSVQRPIEPGVPSGPLAVLHEGAARRYKHAPVGLSAEIVVPSDFPDDVLKTWQDVLPDAGIQPMKCVWQDMLSAPAVKRLAAILAEVQ